MNRIRSRVRDLRISSKILLPLAVTMLALVVATSLLAGYLVSRSIEEGVRDRLVDSRHAVALTLRAWESDTVSAIGHLAEDAYSLTGENGAANLARSVSTQSSRWHLDYATVTFPDGTVLAAGGDRPPPPQAAGENTGTTRLVGTDAGWALESTSRVDVPSLGLVEIRGGRLLADELMSNLHTAVGDRMEVALAVGDSVVAVSGSDETAAACNGCHREQGLVLGGPIDGAAPPDRVEMGSSSSLMLHAPLVIGDTPVGSYTVHVPIDTIVAAQSRARWSVFGIGLAVLVILVGVQALVSRSIARPITRLADASRDIAAGNLDRQLDPAGRDEVGVLSESVATLTRSLAGQIKELSLLQEVSLAANSSLELEEVLESIMESATDVLEADAGSIMLLDSTHAKLEVKTARGPRATSLTETTVGVSSGPAGWVVRNRKPLLLPDDLADPSTDLVLSRPDISSSVIVPIETREALLGVLNLNIYQSDRRFDRRTLAFAQTLAHHSALAIDKARHHQEVNDLYSGLIRALASAIDAKDPYTYGHSEMVHRYAAIIGEHMGLDDFLLKGLETAAYLHDIGKIGVKDAVLSKPSRLTPEERRVVEAHSTIGAQILDQIAFPWPVIETVRHHHERWDGGGYPARLAGGQIPLHARVLAVADSFDAMTSDRPYRMGRSFDEAVTEVLACAGSQFDPDVVEAFLAISGQIGSTLEASRAMGISAA